MSDAEYVIERNRLIRAYVVEKQFQNTYDLMQSLEDLDKAKEAGISLAEFEAQMAARWEKTL